MTRDQLIETLGATTLNLYRALTAGSGGEYVRQLHQDLFDPQPGDLVLDVADWQRPASERLAYLEHYMRSTAAGATVCLVKKLDGRYATWHTARLIKVNQVPFSCKSKSQ